MGTGDRPAFPVVEPGGVYAIGLTKRELFAAMAMQGLLACRDELNSDSFKFARAAIRYADALLAELAKEPTA